MTKEKQQIAILEACGWTYIPEASGIGRIVGCPPEEWKKNHDAIPNLGDGSWYEFPEITLDIMHWAENQKVVGIAPFGQYWNNVYYDTLKIVCKTTKSDMFRATADQRKEAFLKTFNLWEE